MTMIANPDLRRAAHGLAAVVFALAGLLCAASSWGQASSPNTSRRTPIALVDRIVAIVNNEVVTQIELRERLQRVMQELQFRNTTPPDRDMLERQVLDTSTPALIEFYRKYYDSRGYVQCVLRWGADDGPDDAFENFAGWPELPFDFLMFP